MKRETVAVVGGPLDGLVGRIHPYCSRIGFFIHSVENDDPNKEMIWGYYDQGTVDERGRRIFSPKRNSQ